MGFVELINKFIIKLICCIFLSAYFVHSEAQQYPQKYVNKRQMTRPVHDAMSNPALFDKKHGIKMGVPSDGCDDAKTNLFVDWDGDSSNYTCYTPSKPFWPDSNVKSKLFCDPKLPKNYFPQHLCMKDKIEYKDLIPTYGNHRPLWPKYGEYRFVPRQRWLHNIEHGAVVMLYHPCTLEASVQKLRTIVKLCLKKHVITPSTFVTKERPLVLVAWGCSLSMSEVNAEEVINFIKEKGLKGPEGSHAGDGQYDYQILESSSKFGAITDMNDAELCPNV